MRKIIYITIGILGLLLLGFVYFLYTRDIEYVFNDKYYVSFSSYISLTDENTYEGFFHIADLNDEADNVTLSIPDSEGKTIQIDKQDIEFKQNVDMEQLIMERPIPGYIKIKYDNPNIQFFERLECNLKSLPQKCTKSKEIEYIRVESFSFTDISEDVKSLLLYNIGNLIEENKDVLEGRRYSPSIDYELGEYVYKYNKGEIGENDREKMLELIGQGGGDINSSYYFIPIVEDNKVQEKMIESLCENIPRIINENIYFEALNALLANRYCESNYDEEILFDYIKQHTYDDFNELVGVKGLFTKELGACIIATNGEIKNYCLQNLSHIVNTQRFWYNNTVVCNRINSKLDIYCSKEFLYVIYSIF